MIFIYPGTFDPLTFGHTDIIERASSFSERLVVAILENIEKNTFFTIEERLDHLRKATLHLTNVEIISFCGLQVDLHKKYSPAVIIRGLRNESDFAFEQQMAFFNRKMISSAETLFIPTTPEYSYLSSSGVKEIISFGGNIDGMVPPYIKEALINKSINRRN